MDTENKNSREEALTFDIRDEYARLPIAENIIRLLSSDIKVSPLIIDGDWGTGKTEFCQKLISLVKSSTPPPFQPVYIDAFRADHADQPLMTLLAAILTLLPEKEKPKLIKKALPALRFGLKTTGKAAISWLLKQDAVDLGDDFEDAIKKAGDSVVDKAVETMLMDHVKCEESLRTLKDALSAIAVKNPIVLFIDELDRCRPDFSVYMLEVIKHVFDVQGVQIVLITNTQQLKASINHCYGSDVDSQRYLDKFIGYCFHLSTTFKPLNQHEPILASYEHFKSQVLNSTQLKESALTTETALKFINELMKLKQMSLREVETFVRYFEIYQIFTNEKGVGKKTVEGYLLLRIYAIFCQCFNSKMANEFLTEKYTASSIANSLWKDTLCNITEHSWPSMSDLLLAMLILEMPRIPAHLSCSDSAKVELWHSKLSLLFNRGLNYPASYQEKIKIVQTTIRTIQIAQ